jgi:hypothetical protein
MTKTMKNVLSGILRLGKGTATLIGVTVMLAFAVGLASTALASVPGDPFKLGRLNSIDHITRLVGSASDAMLRIDNEGSGTALDLRVEPGEAPMTVDSDKKVADLNADEVDGKSADDFVSEDNTYTEVEVELGIGGGSEVQLFVDCDSGDRILGGGASAPFPGDLLQVSEPTGQGWKVDAVDNGDQSSVSAKAICADFPPLRAVVIMGGPVASRSRNARSSRPRRRR